ncbi:Multidrug resistance protein YcnB [Propionibacterium freudenreichii]|nr:Multidrug resistance protein YcnB [Propionibacterium freudenreichii]SCQ47663.1 Multidrug resistance protein YcnB [Propionibacterium freudenreichii]SCQ55648.1 Multidrug resistance protein YcnB [Propionibacterium freudenreichii]
MGSGMELNWTTRLVVAAVLLAAAFTGLLNQTLMVTAMPMMMHDFGISLSLAQWLTTGNVLVVGVVTPVSAMLYERFSTRALFLWSTGLFIAASVLGFVADNFWPVLAARLLQAVASGIIMSFAQIALLRITSPRRMGTVLGLYMMVVSAGPAIGPVMSGVILEYLSWHALFGAGVLMMAVVFAAAVFTLPNIKAARKIAIDWPSFVLSFVGMGLFLAGISTVQEAPLVGVSMMVAGLLFVAWFARRQWSSAQPLLNLRLLKGATFRRMTVGVMLAFGVFLGTETIIPVLLESHAGRSGFATALVMLPGAVSNVIASPLTGRVFDARGLRTIWAWGSGITVVSAVALLAVSPASAPWAIAGAYLLRVVGTSVMSALPTARALKGLTGEDISHASALLNSLRQVAGALSNTVLVWAVAVVPDFTDGFRLAMAITAAATVVMVVVFARQARLDRAGA